MQFFKNYVQKWVTNAIDALDVLVISSILQPRLCCLEKISTHSVWKPKSWKTCGVRSKSWIYGEKKEFLGNSIILSLIYVKLLSDASFFRLSIPHDDWKHLMVKQNNNTRWNLACDMIECAFKLKNCIDFYTLHQINKSKNSHDHLHKDTLLPQD